MGFPRRKWEDQMIDPTKRCVVTELCDTKDTKPSYMCARLLSHNGLRLFCPWNFLGNLPKHGIEPMSLASPALAGRFFTTSATWEAQTSYIHTLYTASTY